MSRVIVLAGSFNPPTLAHKEILSLAVRVFRADTGLFVPSSNAYVSRKMKNRGPVWSEKDRVAMLEAFSSFPVNMIELGDDGRGHTYETLCGIQKEYPESEIWFLFGTDKLKSLCRWKTRDLLLSQFQIVLTVRETNDETIKNMLQPYPELLKYKSSFHLLRIPKTLRQISSTKVRAAIADQDWKMASTLLDPTTLSYLQK